MMKIKFGVRQILICVLDKLLTSSVTPGNLLTLSEFQFPVICSGLSSRLSLLILYFNENNL